MTRSESARVVGYPLSEGAQRTAGSSSGRRGNGGGQGGDEQVPGPGPQAPAPRPQAPDPRPQAPSSGAPGPRPQAHPLPEGCRIIRGDLKVVGLAQSIAQLRAQIDSPDAPCIHGDAYRRQVEMSVDNPVARHLLDVLRIAGELIGRECTEMSCIGSLPGGKQQDPHWDYDDSEYLDLVCKPKGAILAIDKGFRLVIFRGI